MPNVEKENLKIMFELKQENSSRLMIFNSLILLLNEYKFYDEQIETGVATTKVIDIANDILDRAKKIIELMKVEEGELK